MKKLNLLREEVNKNLENFTKKKQTNYVAHNWTGISNFTLGAAIALSLSLYQEDAAHFSAVCGAIISINEYLASHFKFRSKWLMYLETSNKMKVISLKLKRLESEVNLPKIEEVYNLTEELQQILNEQNIQWKELMAK